jgi:ribosome-associated translation inhibitor RaiA
MSASPVLEAQVVKRIGRLERLRSDIVSCRVVIAAPNHSHEAKPPLAISIDVEVPQRTVIAKEVEPRRETKHDVYAVINRAFDAVERQLEDDIRIRRERSHPRNGEKRASRLALLAPQHDEG